MEYLQVFDKNKNVLNEKIDRDETSNLQPEKYFMIVLIFIENEKGEFLLQKTSKSRGSCIATTGGHVAYKDTAIETVVKECKEELGLDISENNINHINTILRHCFYLETFYTKMDIDINKLTLQEEEVESVKWYTKEEIQKLIKTGEFREGNIDPFNEVLKYKETMKCC